MTNRLYYGDNLDVLRDHVPDASVDLIYLDPPFNSNAGYNVLFRSASGAGADASIEAFDDTWTWGDSAKEALLDIAAGTNRPLTVMMQAIQSAIGENPLMANLAMMAVRLGGVAQDAGCRHRPCHRQAGAGRQGRQGDRGCAGAVCEDAVRAISA